MAYLPHFPTQRTKETLQNQKLQSWFLPINGQWIIDDRVPRSHGEVVLERNHVTLTETTRSLWVLEMKHEKFSEMRDLCKSCQPSCRFPNPSARIFMPWFAGRLQEGSGAYFGMVIILAIWPDSLLLLGKKHLATFATSFGGHFCWHPSDLANHCGKFRWSTHLNLVGWGAIPSNHPGRFCPGCWLRITCSLEFSWLRLGRKRHFVGFLWRSICSLTLNTKPLKCNQIPFGSIF